MVKMLTSHEGYFKCTSMVYTTLYVIILFTHWKLDVQFFIFLSPPVPILNSHCKQKSSRKQRRSNWASYNLFFIRIYLQSKGGILYCYQELKG